MATLTLNRPDVFGPSQAVGVYPAEAFTWGQAPRAASVATGTTDTAGALSITSANILQGTLYAVAAQVGGQWVGLRAKSTLDVFDYGKATGTCNTTSGSAAIASVSVSSGALAVGQQFYAPGFENGAYINSGSGASWVVSSPATATATGVSFESHGGQVPAAVLGATAVPSRIRTPWQAQLRQRRQLMGTAI